MSDCQPKTMTRRDAVGRPDRPIGVRDLVGGDDGRMVVLGVVRRDEALEIGNGRDLLGDAFEDQRLVAVLQGDADVRVRA